MLQGDVTAYDVVNDRVVTRGFPPHVMFYAAGVNHDDVKLGPEGTQQPFLFRRSQYHGYFIAPLASATK